MPQSLSIRKHELVPAMSCRHEFDDVGSGGCVESEEGCARGIGAVECVSLQTGSVRRRRRNHALPTRRGQFPTSVRFYLRWRRNEL